jgi:two-component sensor histidine kinase
MLGLLLLAALPVLVLAAVSGHARWQAVMERAAAETALERDRAIAVNRAAIEGTEALLLGLSAAIAAEPSQCASILAAAALPGLRLSLRDAPGNDRCTGRQASLGAAASDASPAPDAPAFLLRRPVGAEGLVLTARLAPRVTREDAALWLVGAEGEVQALGPAAEPPLPGIPEEGAVRPMQLDGAPWLVSAGQVAAGQRLVIGFPAAGARDAAFRAAATHLAEIAVLLSLSLAAVLLGTSHAVTRPLRALRDAVVRWDAGARPLEIPPDANLPAELQELADRIEAGAVTLARREAELRATIAHAELLAGEVHHRVKNNLQTVNSLLALQANRVSDPAARAEFAAARDRVGALATLHRHLYQEHDPEAIDFGPFLAELGAGLFAAVGERPGRRIALEVEAPSLRIGTDQAVPLTLVITEAVADALRQGFPGDRAGRIAIRLEAEDGRARLTITDDGALPRPEDPLRAMLLRGLGRQLGGTLKAEGGRVALDFPLRPPENRQPVSLRPPSPPPAPSSPA